MNFSFQPDLYAWKSAQYWALNKEWEACLIVLNALWKKHPKKTEIFIAILEVLEEKNSQDAFNLYACALSGEDDWMAFLEEISENGRALIFERMGLLALKLKDESCALENLRKAASLGRDSLKLWAPLAFLLALQQDYSMALKALFRALKLYQEPSLFDEMEFSSFIDPQRSKEPISEELFLNISLILIPKVQEKEAQKLIKSLEISFPKRSWLQELQEIVTQTSKEVPIGISGEDYASSDTKNR
jgi:tetratricopeptide (TPR) repeat protein